MKYVYIPTEIKVRDFRSRLLIALKCADYGMTVIFGINNYIKKIIPNSPPGIYLDKSVSINKLSFLTTLKKKKIRFFVLMKSQLHSLIILKFIRTKDLITKILRY